MSWFSNEVDVLLAKIENVPDSVKATLNKLETDAGQEAQSLAALAAKDIVQGGIINTASYVAAAKDILAKVTADGVTIILPDVFFILNAEVSYLLTPVVVVTPPVPPVEPPPAPLAA